MEERIITVAEFSTQALEKKKNEEIKKSLAGVLFPLIVPACILLYMLTEGIEFDRLDSTIKILFWGGILASAVLGYLHTKKISIEESETAKANAGAVKQSLIVTNKRVYGRNKTSDFSYSYNDIVKAYSTQTVGQPPVLIVKLSNENRLEFEHVCNSSTVISCINDLRAQSKKQVRMTNATAAAAAVPETVPAVDNTVDANDIACELFDVVITSASGSISQIKTLRQVTFFDLDTAKKCFSKLPYTVAEGKEKSDAQKMKEILESSGMTVALNKR